MTANSEPERRTCDECHSRYVAAASAMQNVCPECAHRLYGHPPCAHEFVGGECKTCGWDGSVSPYLARRDEETP